jgi:hypothetical protein
MRGDTSPSGEAPFVESCPSATQPASHPIKTLAHKNKRALGAVALWGVPRAKATVGSATDRLPESPMPAPKHPTLVTRGDAMPQVANVQSRHTCTARVIASLHVCTSCMCDTSLDMHQACFVSHAARVSRIDATKTVSTH